MKEIKGDIFTVEADAICVTTNGVVMRNGELVMGAGIAKEFRDRFPGLAGFLGEKVKDQGNHVYHSFEYPRGGKETLVISFPTKNDWRADSNIKLIVRSAVELVEKIKELEQKHPDRSFKTIALPRPGCGFGRLKWEQVKAVLEPILDDRFVIVTLGGI